MFLQESYQVESIKFINYTELDYNVLEEILTWRNHPDVRKWMYNTEEISLSDHLQFCEKLKHTNNKGYWLIQMGGDSIGTININPYDSEKNECEWGFFLNPKHFKSDAVLFLFYYSIELFFNEFKLDQIRGYVLKTNMSSLILNDFFGMLEQLDETQSKQQYSSRRLIQTEWKELNFTPESVKSRFVKFVKNYRLKQ